MPQQGLYIHVPFCKIRCIYCDFYSTTCGAAEQQAYVRALVGELRERRGYLDGSALGSVYIGGGTPSVLPVPLLRQVFDAVSSLWELAPDAEITLEANPDDVTPQFARELASLPVNRVSMGVQTFNDDHLRLLNRRHTAQQAVEAVGNLRDAGIDNISIDLIYGLPNQTLDQWRRDLDKAFSLPVSHLSAYALIYEEGTRLHAMREAGLVREADEELSLQMFHLLMDEAAAHGFEHYEISNFALPHRRARHNSGYWASMHYLGAGPTAHSFDGNSRQWNTPSLEDYIKQYSSAAKDNVQWSMVNGQSKELLTPEQKIEETLLTRLRTAAGLNLHDFRRDFGAQQADALLARALPYINSGHLALAAPAPRSFLAAPAQSIAADTPLSATENFLCLTRKGIFISDGIIASLFN